MTLSSKKRRRIIVDGNCFFWFTRYEYCKDGGDHYSEHILLAESTSTPHGLLMARFDSRAIYPSAYRWKYADALAITPRVVEAVVRYAVNQGWPESPRTFEMPFEDTSVRFANVLREAGEVSHKWVAPSWYAAKDK